MFGHFVNVLVPIHLHSEDDKAINIAIHLADPRFCVIHLLDVVKPTLLSSLFARRASGPEIPGIGIHRCVKEILELSKFKTMIEQSRPNSVVKIHICKSGNVQDVIAWYANRLSVQVVIIPESGKRSVLSLEDIAGKTRCKILGFRDGVLFIVEKRDPFGEYFQFGDVRRKVDAMGCYFCDN